MPMNCCQVPNLEVSGVDFYSCLHFIDMLIICRQCKINFLELQPSLAWIYFIYRYLFFIYFSFLNFVFVCPGPVASTSILTEEQMTTMSPTAAAISKIKPGMKLTEVRTAQG